MQAYSFETDAIGLFAGLLESCPPRDRRGAFAGANGATVRGNDYTL